MKSRVAITAILMLGLVTGGTGTTLALDSGGQGNAAQVQYPREAPPRDQVLGTQQGGEGGGDVRGTTQEGTTPSGSGAVQGSQQVVAAESGNSSLPFTGLAAVPLIIVGLGLIMLGMMMYRSARQDPSGA